MPDKHRSLKYYTLFGFFVIGVITVLLGQVLPILRGRLQLNDAQAGLLLSAQYAGALLGTLIVGRVIRRFGFAFAGLAGLILIMAGLPALNLEVFIGCWIGIFVYGLGIGLAIPAFNLLTIEDTPLELQSSAVNLLNFAWGVGAICSQPFVATVSGGASVAAVTIILLLALFAVAICFLSVVRKLHREKSVAPAYDSTERIWRRRDAWLFLVFGFFVIGVESGLHGWLTTYSNSLQETHGPQINATVVFFSFYVLGRGLASFVARGVSENKLISICSATLLLGVFLIVMNESLVLVGSAIAGLGCSAIFPTNMVRFSKLFGPGATRQATPIFIAGTAGAAAMASLVGFISFRLGELRWGLGVLLAGAAMVAILQWIMASVFRDRVNVGTKV